MRDWSRQVVVTGAGVCCNLGDDIAAMEAALRAGKNQPFTEWAPAVEYHARNQIIGEYFGDVSDAALGLKKAQSRFLGRAARLALKATQSALRQAQADPSDFAVVVGSGTGDVKAHIEIERQLQKTKDCKKIRPTVIPRIMSSTVSANLVNVLKCRGPSLSATAACAGGAYNVLLAAMLIEQGHVDGAIAGGVEGTDIHFHAGFDAMRAYNGVDNDQPSRASRPYAADREGFIFGEGAGITVLETRKSAEARGAKILGAIVGYGLSSDGQGDMVVPEPDGAYRALTKAIAHAELSAEEIDYVNTHGTSTPRGDLMEVRALRRCFSDRVVRYSSTKGYTGHTVSAAGAIEAIFTMAMVRDGWVAPSVNAEPLDPELLDYPPVLAPLDCTLRHAISNSFGFGGTNVALVLSAEPRAL
ncbi:MAG: beta-ketoacyl-ACP synthase I [Deltaproteobacteria bacterium]|nr:MAG: beta-ketoacyl-ACP synthase I [Deltaproteobacteria bacterium]